MWTALVFFALAGIACRFRDSILTLLESNIEYEKIEYPVIDGEVISTDGEAARRE